jgi:hypothetical protein
MGLPTANPQIAFGPERRPVPLPSLLAFAQEVFLVVVEVRRHQAWIVLSRWRLEGAEVRAVGFAALIERDVLKRWRDGLNGVEEISQNGDVDR